MTWRLPLLRRAFVGASVVWSLALPAATLASSGQHSSSALYLLALVVYFTGGVVCHQRPERSFFLWGSQMPVCARCTGIYLGAAVSALTAVAFAARLKLSRSNNGSSRIALFVGVLPTALTLAYEWSTDRTPANWIRAVAGVPIGVVVAWILCRLRPDGVEG